MEELVTWSEGGFSRSLGSHLRLCNKQSVFQVVAKGPLLSLGNNNASIISFALGSGPRLVSCEPVKRQKDSAQAMAQVLLASR